MMIYVLIIIAILALIGFLVWWFVYRNKTPKPETPAATVTYASVPSSAQSNYQSRQQGSRIPSNMGYTTHVPSIIETEQRLVDMNMQERMLPDLIPRSGRNEISIRGEIPIQPRTDNGIMRPLNAELIAESRFINTYSNDNGYKSIM